MNPIVHEFMRATYPLNCSRPPQDEGVPQPPLELPLPEGAALIPLPAPGSLDIREAGLRAVIERRRSLRKYSGQPLSLAELSYLLWLTQGVKEITSRPATLRPVPSAGARHAFETFLLVNAVGGLTPGVYRFAASHHALLPLDMPETAREDIIHACWDQKQVRHGPVTFLWAAIAERMTWRYTERGYRYLFLDAGHVCQNLYLAAESIGCGACAIGSFQDDVLNGLLGLDGENQFVIYLASVGKR
ncbi:MAG TPA: SagB/ThcOx family dehydrogenase [Anaerolineaceae bacterium]